MQSLLLQIDEAEIVAQKADEPNAFVDFFHAQALSGEHANAFSDWTDCGFLRLGGARDEFLLAATAKNLREIAKLIPAQNPVIAG